MKTILLLIGVIIAFAILFCPLYWAIVLSPWYLTLFFVSWLPASFFAEIWEIVIKSL